jgi:hypothetical protein
VRKYNAFIKNAKFRKRSAYFCSMSVRLQLKFSPKEANDEPFLVRNFLQKAGIQNGTVVWVKKSLESRGRVTYFLISADVYSADEVPQKKYRFSITKCKSI